MVGEEEKRQGYTYYRKREIMGGGKIQEFKKGEENQWDRKISKGKKEEKGKKEKRWKREKGKKGKREKDGNRIPVKYIPLRGGEAAEKGKGSEAIYPYSILIFIPFFSSHYNRNYCYFVVVLKSVKIYYNQY